MDQAVLKEILDKHGKWLRGEEGGERANLREANLYGANLRWANLYGADLYGANLREANLYGANLRWANLYGADLYGADLYGADLYGADLRGADLRGADLRGANLCGANLRGADLRWADLYGANLHGAKNIDQTRWDNQTQFFALQCPEKGSYTAYKKAGGKIVELEILADALRSSATTRKCRASKAYVRSITDLDGNLAGNTVCSDHDEDFIYTVGQTVEAPDFDPDRWNECAPGIHHYLTRAEAVRY